MIEVKEQYPYIDEDGIEHSDLIKFYCQDIDSNKLYKLIQNETGKVYDKAIDVYPSRYTYSPSKEEIEVIEEIEEINLA